jgi:hypothetical protein
MKKLLIILLIMFLSLSLISCGLINQATESAENAIEEATEEAVEEAIEAETGTEIEIDGDEYGTSTDMPEDYPSDAVPIVGADTSDLIFSSSVDYGDGMTFTLSFDVDEDVDTVADEVKATYEGISEDGYYYIAESGSSTIISGTTGGYDYIITITDEDDEYNTLVNYTVGGASE